MIADSQHSDRLVLIFISTGLAILIMFTSLIVINNRTFADKTYYRTVVDNAKGLSGKPPVLFKGLEIGRVENFELNPQTNDIEVDFWVFDEYKSKMVQYAVLAGHQNTLLGEISPLALVLPLVDRVGDYRPLEEGGLVPHISSRLAQDYSQKGYILTEGDSIDSIIASVNTLLLNLQQENNPEAGSLFRILDRVAKITDHLLSFSEALRHSAVLPEAEQMLRDGKHFFGEFPATLAKVNRLLDDADKAALNVDRVLDNYAQPGALISEVTGGKIPPLLDNADASLTLLQALLKDVYAQREQLVITIIQVQKVLDKFDKTLQGLNNNPLLKQGIAPAANHTGIEMND